MKWAALIAWLVTAGGGFVLLAIWLRRGGMRQREGERLIKPPLILSHFALAATGLVIWIIYLATDSDALGWIALVALGVVALLGFGMFSVWYWQRQQGGAAAAGTASTDVGTAAPGAPGVAAEQHFPVSIVALHGLLAVTTVALVFLTDIGVGGS
jgi:manganese efflux pump family protein